MKRVLSHLLCIALVLLCSALMPIMLFFSNVGAVKFYEIAIFIGIYSFIGLAAFAILRLLMKSEHKAAISTGIFILTFQNAGRLAKIIQYKIVLAIFILVIGVLVFAVWKFLKDEIAKVFVPVLSAVLSMLLIMNTILSMGKIISLANVNSEIQSDIDKQYEYIKSFKTESETPKELPNIYFIIPDEYAGFNTLEKFYDYDNSEFKAFLEDNKFDISYSSTNYMNQTFECLSNVFNLEVSEKNSYANTSERYCQSKVQRSLIFKLAEDCGYTVNVAQTNDLVNYESKTEIYGDKWSKTGDNESIIDLLAAPSMLAPFTDRIRAVLNGVSVDYFVGQKQEVKLKPQFAPLEYFAESENVGKKNSFNLCYTNIPHVPFIFDQDGNILEDQSHRNDWGDKSYYLGQLKYCTTLFEDAVEKIIENDPDSIIILMSDHGARDHSSEIPNAQWMSKMTPKDTANILCAVYYKGEEFIDIEGMCGSNVLISIINKAWGYSIPLIEQSDDMYYKTP